eukprot:9895220-Lingulodinium_polyedra.AAC.1
MGGQSPARLTGRPAGRPAARRGGLRAGAAVAGVPGRSARSGHRGYLCRPGRRPAFGRLLGGP